jgi:hypothetical protein
MSKRIKSGVWLGVRKQLLPLEGYLPQIRPLRQWLAKFGKAFAEKLRPANV